MYKQYQDNIGYFVEKDYNHEFTYRKTTNEWALKHDFEYEVDVGFLNEVRFCNVKKTRAYICTGEGLDGKPVVETWVLSKHVIFEG